MQFKMKSASGLKQFLDVCKPGSKIWIPFKSRIIKTLTHTFSENCNSLYLVSFSFHKVLWSVSEMYLQNYN